MGNNNSQPSGFKNVEVVRRPPSRPNEPPSARPLSSLGPQGPSYHSPENLVLPRELPHNIRLRPVSMELSKYNPDYEQMFQYQDMNGLDTDNNNEKISGLVSEDTTKLGSPPRPPPPPLQNGHLPGSTPPGLTPSLPDETDSKLPVKSANHVPYKPSHRRQMSLTNNLTGHTIMEEPEEDIDSRIKLDPLQQSFPGATGPSLPVKNTSNLDYSYQLTYAQLAEARRNKTLEDLEKKTGKKLSDLSADLNDHADKPSFERGTPSRTSSKSLGSGVSSKKKKAPPPPGAPPPPPPTASSVPNTPRGYLPYSIHNEPPADYDLLESPRKPEKIVLPRYSAKVSNVKPMSRNTPQSPPPPPPPGQMSNVPKKAVNLSRNNSLNTAKPEMVLRRAPSVSSPKPEEKEDGAIPWLLEIKAKSEARIKRQQSQESITSLERPGMSEILVKRLTSEERTVLDDIDQVINDGAADINDMNDEINKVNAVEKDNEQGAKNEDKTDKRSVERSNSLKEASKPAAPKLQRHFSTTSYDKTASQQTPPGSVDPVRRLNSLLQHDIKAAASAKCTKLVKQTTPVKPKPKDPHQVFREQLQKACAARDERVKVEGTIDDNLKKPELDFGQVIDDTDDDVDSTRMVNDRDSEKDTSSLSSREPPDVLPKPPRYHKNVTLNKQSSNINNKPRHIKSINENARDKKRVISQSLDWTPEDDLDSDDNLSDREAITGRNIAADGFKSTIIPSSVNDLKMKKKGKQKKPKDAPVTEDQNRNKMGSVKKFKKSMHKSVRNAFGSISKASGKILRKSKSEDFEEVQDAPKNWTFGNEPHKRFNGELHRASTFNGHRGYQEDSDSDSDKLMEERDFSPAIFQQNGDIHSDESTPEEEELNSSQTIKRAGVAYVNQEGKLVVIPDAGAETNKEDKVARKLAKQKERERQNYDSLKKAEKAAKAARSEEMLREQARRNEMDQRKKLEMELELTRLREAETRERLQRLETAHLQQQISSQLLQQQQQQQQQQSVTMLTAPPLPASGSYTTLPNTPQTQSYTNLFGQQIPQGNYGLSFPQNGPLLQNNVPYDLNEYMRMLGIQNPPTTQQMAFFLNNMTLQGQPYDMSSSPNLFNMVNPDGLKQFSNGPVGYQNINTTGVKQNFQTWASSPNIHSAPTSVSNPSIPLADFVNDYNGATTTTTTTKTDSEKKANTHNPLYNSDESDDGLSPQRTVTCGAVTEYRTLPGRTESSKFMKQFGNDYRTLPVRTESGKFMKQYSGDYSENKSVESDYHVVRIENSAPDLHHHLSQRQRSVSPSNSSSTIDSAITSAGSTLSTPSMQAQSHEVPPSPSVSIRSSASGYKTVLDLSSPACKAKIYMDDGSQVDDN